MPSQQMTEAEMEVEAIRASRWDELAERCKPLVAAIDRIETICMERSPTMPDATLDKVLDIARAALTRTGISTKTERNK